MKRSGLILSLLILITGSLAGEIRAAAEVPKTGMCPVMEGTRASKKFYVEYEGKRIYLCCRSCVRAFKKHPEKYLSRIAF